MCFGLFKFKVSGNPSLRVRNSAVHQLDDILVTWIMADLLRDLWKREEVPYRINSTQLFLWESTVALVISDCSTYTGARTRTPGFKFVCDRARTNSAAIL